METIKIGILGLGTVGSGVIRILRDHAEKFPTLQAEGSKSRQSSCTISKRSVPLI